ncbi:MAG: hypothetical protein V1773_14280 [bacterium]
MIKKYKYILFNFFIIFITSHLFCEVRYVSKTTGSSDPPYITWETACDSLQKCIDFCNIGDTICINRGIYKETILVRDKDLAILGLDTDECIIDGAGILGKVVKKQRI